MGEAKERRKLVEHRLRERLQALSFRRLRDKARFLTDAWTEEPLQTLLLVGVDTDRYGTVRIGGAVTVVAPAVDELFQTVPPTALTRAQEIYAGRLPHDLAGISFQTLLDPGRMTPLEWRVKEDDDVEPEVDGFVQAVDGPVRDWVARHATVDAVRAAAEEARGRPNEGAVVRNIAALEGLRGDLEGALARIERYRGALSKGDTPERMQAFVDWLPEAVASSGR